jgi:hypothetical protein
MSQAPISPLGRRMMRSFFLFLSLTPSSKDREINNEIRSALYLARTKYRSHIHLSYLG